LSDAERTIDTVRRGLAAFSRGDFEAAAHEIHPDIEWHVTFRLPDLPLPKDVYRGPEEVLQLWRAFTSAWETMETEIEEILYVDAERALLRVRFAGRGAESGVGGEPHPLSGLPPARGAAHLLTRPRRRGVGAPRPGPHRWLS
jgi:ketosteroid isomerase-like protein